MTNQSGKENEDIDIASIAKCSSTSDRRLYEQMAFDLNLDSTFKMARLQHALKRVITFRKGKNQWWRVFSLYQYIKKSSRHFARATKIIKLLISKKHR